MDDLIAKLTVFPTWIFSVLMVAAALYWLLVIVGALDIDLIPGGGEGHGEHAGDHDPAGGHNANVVLEFLNIGKVPVTIILSTMVFAGWTVTFFGTTLARQWLPDWSHGLVGVVLIAAALVAGVFAAAWGLRPLAKVFSLQSPTSARDLIGKMVVVTSSAVDARFGTARHDAPSGEDLLLNVVCRPEHRLVKGEQAVVMDHDRATGVYTIAPLPHTRPGFLDEAKPAADSPPIPPSQAQ